MSGLYHGVSPGMGWPLAVSAALFEGRPAALFKALLAIGVGHFAAVGLVLLPFAALEWMADRAAPIRIFAGLLVIGFGLYLLIYRRHPRALARIRPDQLLLWGFVVAIAHGAGLMLVPIYLGTPRQTHGHVHGGHMSDEMAGIASVLNVSLVHTLAMIAAGAVLGWLVYRYLGLRFLRKSWFNLEALWAISLILVGSIGIASA